MTTDSPLDLDALLAEARAVSPVPSADLVARVLADADRALAGEAGPELAVAPVVAARAGRGWLSALGGWPAMGGLMASAVVGVWIGAAPPAALADTAAGLAGTIWGEGVAVAVGADDDPFALLGG